MNDMEKDIKQAAFAEIDKICSHTTLYKGTSDELEVYEPDDMMRMFKAGAKWALEMLWSDLTEAPEKSDGIIILDDRDEIRQCKKDGSYYEDKKDGLPMLNDEVCSFISIESLHKKLTEGLW